MSAYHIEKTDLNHGIKSGAKLTLERLFDLNHVDLTARHNHSYQSVVLCAGSLATARQSICTNANWKHAGQQ